MSRLLLLLLLTFAAVTTVILSGSITVHGESTASEAIDVVLPVHYAIETAATGKSATRWKERSGGIKFVVNKSEKKISAKFVEPSMKLAPGEIEEMRRNPEGFYHFRVATLDHEGKVNDKRFVMTSVRNCALLSEGKEVLSLATDQTGAIIGIQYDRPVSGSSCAAAAATVAAGSSSSPLAKVGADGSIEVVGKIVIQLPKTVAPLPGSALAMPSLSSSSSSSSSGGASGANGDGAPGAIGEDGEKPPPQQSVFQKYWYLFVGLTLISFFLQPPAPEAPAGGPAGASAAPRPKKD